ETDVPQECDQGLDGAAAAQVRRLRHEQQDVDVGAGVQLATPVATYRDQCPLWKRGAVSAPRLAQHRIDERGARLDELLDRLRGEEARLELLLGRAQEIPPRQTLTLRGEPR